jgi:hypothetical protein
MAIEIINLGNAVNDGTGDDLRTAFRKTKNNFDELRNLKTDFEKDRPLVQKLLDYDFGSFVSGGANGNTSVLQIILQATNIELGSITSPNSFNLDLGSIINGVEITNAIDGGGA